MAEVLKYFCNSEEFKISRISNEREFQKIIINKSDIFFKDYFVMDWDYKVKTPNYETDVRPDLCFVKKDFSIWIIVEVELQGHSFNDHVLPQIKKIESGIDYNSEKTFDRIVKKLSLIDKKSIKKLRNLVLLNDPLFLVIADKVNSSWKKTLTHFNFMYLSIVRYVSYKNKSNYSLSDDIPEYWINEKKSVCIYNDLRFLDIRNPSRFGDNLFLQNKNKIKMNYYGEILSWFVDKSRDSLRLYPLNHAAHKLKNLKYIVLVYENGDIYLQKYKE